MTRSTLIGCGAAALALATLANAGISGTTGGDSFSGPGWDVPPASLGGWVMTQYDQFDPFLNDLDLTTVASSDIFSTHTTTFAADTQMRIAGSSWATWSGGYAGSVYWSMDLTEVSASLSGGTVAYSLFFEPNAFEDHDFEITAWDSNGDFVTVGTVTNGSAGATWAGFWTDGGTTITNLRVTSDATFAIGRIGYSLVPAPGAIALLGLGGLIARRRRN